MYLPSGDQSGDPPKSTILNGQPFHSAEVVGVDDVDVGHIGAMGSLRSQDPSALIT
jgi:hypothetical protein